MNNNKIIEKGGELSITMIEIIKRDYDVRAAFVNMQRSY